MKDKYIKMIYVFVFFIGSIFGSFINVVGYRSVRKQDFIVSRSICPSCKHQLPFVFMIPIISYLFLRGKCYYCKSKISIRYLVIEIIGGIIALVSVFCFQRREIIYYFLLLNILLLMALIDYETKEVDYIYQILFLITVLLIGLNGSKLHLLMSIIVLIMGFILVLLSQAIGGADVIIFSILSLIEGKNIIYTYLITLFLSLIYSIYLIIFKKKNMKESIAMIPFIFLAYLIYLIFKEELIVNFPLF